MGLIGFAADTAKELAAFGVHTLRGLRAQPFEYESTTRLPQPLGPVIYRQRFKPGTPPRDQAQIIVVVSADAVRDSSEPYLMGMVVASEASKGYDELRARLRAREAGSPGIEPGPSG